jgi:hypothetical protein
LVARGDHDLRFPRIGNSRPQYRDLSLICDFFEKYTSYLDQSGDSQCGISSTYSPDLFSEKIPVWVCFAAGEGHLPAESAFKPWYLVKYLRTADPEPGELGGQVPSRGLLTHHQPPGAVDYKFPVKDSSISTSDQKDTSVQYKCQEVPCVGEEELNNLVEENLQKSPIWGEFIWAKYQGEKVLGAGESPSLRVNPQYTSAAFLPFHLCVCDISISYLLPPLSTIDHSILPSPSLPVQGAVQGIIRGQYQPSQWSTPASAVTVFCSVQTSQ